MPAATNKSGLLATFDRERTKLAATLAAVCVVKAQFRAADHPASIKGIIAHRTHWIARFHVWYEDGLAGRPVHIPAEGYTWAMLTSYNQALYDNGDRMEWDDLMTRFEAEADRLRALIVSLDDDVLYASKRFGWTGKWTLGRWAEASGPSHFRSANINIRKILRSA